MSEILSNLQQRINEDLNKSYVTSNVLCSSFLFLSEESKKSPAYLDPKYIPFYYYLGKYIKPKRMIELGLRLGLFSSCFLNSCKTVEHLTSYQKKNSEFYSPRLALRNIRMNYRGGIEVIIEEHLPELQGKFDLAIVNEESHYDDHRFYLDILWEHLELGGLIVHDYIHSHKPAGAAFTDFAKIKNREAVQIPTRYGVGLIFK